MYFEGSIYACLLLELEVIRSSGLRNGCANSNVEITCPHKVLYIEYYHYIMIYLRLTCLGELLRAWL